MNTGSKDNVLSADSSPLATAEQRIRQLGIKLPAPPEPFGTYAEAVQAGSLLLWGKYDLSFDPSEPEAYRRDVPTAA